jgi:hypothetical protein
LNKIEAAHSTLTLTKHYEHLGIENCLKSLCEHSIQRGLGNSKIYTQIHHTIKDYIKLGYFQDDAYLGRLPFAGIKQLTRAALYVPYERLHVLQDRIKLRALELGNNPDEVFNVLVACSTNAATNGAFEFSSVTAQRAFHILNALPERVRVGVLQGRYASVRLFTASVD